MTGVIGRGRAAGRESSPRPGGAGPWIWRTSMKQVVAVLGPLVGLVVVLAAPSPARAHCDTMDGPVVVEARAALASGDVEPVLKWVPPEGEAVVREAFQRTLAV